MLDFCIHFFFVVRPLFEFEFAGYIHDDKYLNDVDEYGAKVSRIHMHDKQMCNRTNSCVFVCFSYGKVYFYKKKKIKNIWLVFEFE